MTAIQMNQLIDTHKDELFALLEEQAFIQGVHLGGNLTHEIFMDQTSQNPRP